MNSSLKKFALINIPIGKSYLSLSLLHVLFKFSLIKISIIPLYFTISMKVSFEELSLIRVPLITLQLSITMIVVIFPSPIIDDFFHFFVINFSCLLEIVLIISLEYETIGKQTVTQTLF